MLLSTTKNHRIVEPALESIAECTNDNKSRQATILLTSLQSLIRNQEILKNHFESLPPVNIPVVDNKTMLIEWCFSDFRIGFSFEEEEAESSWYLVSTQTLGDIQSHGVLNGENQDMLLRWLLQFVIENT